MALIKKIDLDYQTLAELTARFLENNFNCATHVEINDDETFTLSIMNKKEDKILSDDILEYRS